MKRSGKERSQRQLRVAERVKRIIAEVFQRESFKTALLNDNIGMLSIEEVQVSPDLKYATAFIAFLIPGKENEIIDALNQEAHIFSHHVAKNMDTKYTPKVAFALDQSSDAIDHINKLLKEII